MGFGCALEVHRICMTARCLEGKEAIVEECRIGFAVQVCDT